MAGVELVLYAIGAIAAIDIKTHTSTSILVQAVDSWTMVNVTDDEKLGKTIDMKKFLGCLKQRKQHGRKAYDPFAQGLPSHYRRLAS